MALINLTHNITDFFIFGYFLDETPNIDITEFKTMHFQNCNTVADDFKLDQDTQCKLERIHAYLAEHYVSQVFSKFDLRECNMWDGVDPKSSIWHNDYFSNSAFNSNILIYLDDNTEDNGNSIEVRSNESYVKLHPKENQLLWLNQQHTFQHKATHATGRRRLLSFEFFIDELA